MEFFKRIHPVTQALLATIFTWGMTALGAAVVLLAQPILPYALSFAAGAMICVVIEELIPESQRGGYVDYATIGTLLGFGIMMTLDVGFGS